MRTFSVCIKFVVVNVIVIVGLSVLVFVILFGNSHPIHIDRTKQIVACSIPSSIHLDVYTYSCVITKHTIIQTAGALYCCNGDCSCFVCRFANYERDWLDRNIWYHRPWKRHTSDISELRMQRSAHKSFLSNLRWPSFDDYWNWQYTYYNIFLKHCDPRMHGRYYIVHTALTTE